MVLRLPEELREKFKEPLGKVMLDSQANKENVLREVPPGAVLVTVGDATTEKLMRFGIMPSLQIVDGVERRISRDVPDSPQPITTIRCKNPPGGITPECVEAIKSALDSELPIRIVIDGEEDLLVLPVCMHAPDGAIVMYGQPGVGLVVVRINAEARNKTKLLLESMTDGV